MRMALGQAFGMLDAISTDGLNAVLIVLLTTMALVAAGFHQHGFHDSTARHCLHRTMPGASGANAGTGTARCPALFAAAPAHAEHVITVSSRTFLSTCNVTLP